MKSRLFFVLMTLVLVVVCGQTPQAKAAEPTIDIWAAAAEGNIEAIKRHASAGADLNAKDTTGGSTPLILTAVFGQTEAARLLIEKGADLNAKNNEGATALIVAAAFGQTEAARLLIEKGADLNAKNNAGSTALHTAAFLCQTETVKLLLEKGAEVNSRNFGLQTPLDTVAPSWSPVLEEIYRSIAGLMQIKVDFEKIKAARPQIATLLRESGGKTGSELKTEKETPK